MATISLKINIVKSNNIKTMQVGLLTVTACAAELTANRLNHIRGKLSAVL